MWRHANIHIKTYTYIRILRHLSYVDSTISRNRLEIMQTNAKIASKSAQCKCIRTYNHILIFKSWVEVTKLWPRVRRVRRVIDDAAVVDRHTYHSPQDLAITLDCMWIWIILASIQTASFASSLQYLYNTTETVCW